MLNPLETREMQMKRYPISTKYKNKKSENIQRWQSCTENGTHSLTQYKLSRLLCRAIWQCLIQMKTYTQLKFQAYIQNLVHLHKVTGSKMFTAQNRKWPLYSSIGEQKIKHRTFSYHEKYWREEIKGYELALYR